MSSDSGEKTEEPTSKKLEEAFDQGQFAQAAEISMSFVLLAGLISSVFFAKPIAARVSELGISIFSHLQVEGFGLDKIVLEVENLFLSISSYLIPFFIMLFGAAILGGAIQTGFKLTKKTVEPKFSKLSWSAGVKRIISLDSLVRSGFDLLKLFCISFILYISLKKTIHDPIFLNAVSIDHLLSFIFSCVIVLLGKLVFVMFFIGICNYLFKKYSVRKKLMMTRQEVKDERKNQEMDPAIRLAQRRNSLRILRKKMLNDVEYSDVIVTNPTHFAVALKYEKEKDSAPIVLAKGQNLFAKKIKKLGLSHGVPLVENKPLARLLFKNGVVGKSIPYESYQVVAMVLAYVYRSYRYYFYRLNKKRATRGKFLV